MSQTIYKYPFLINDEFEIALPERAQVLCVQEQRGQPCMWALVDPDLPPKRRKFFLRGTGHDCADLRINPTNYVGPFQLRGGDLVFHVFEAK